MKCGEKWEIIYDVQKPVPSKAVGTITSITGNIIEIDGKYILNANNIIRGTKLEDDSFD